MSFPSSSNNATGKFGLAQSSGWNQPNQTASFGFGNFGDTSGNKPQNSQTFGTAQNSMNNLGNSLKVIYRKYFWADEFRSAESVSAIIRYFRSNSASEYFWPNPSI
jgi:hypothetical protein